MSTFEVTCAGHMRRTNRRKMRLPSAPEDECREESQEGDAAFYQMSNYFGHFFFFFSNFSSSLILKSKHQYDIDSMRTLHIYG